MYEYSAVVIKEIDGDTVHADIDLGFHVWLRDISLRFAGINAPEISTPEGKNAAAALATLLPVGTLLVIRTTKRPDDKYGGRYDAWLRRADDPTPAVHNTWVNRWMVDHGYAVPLPPLPVDPPSS